MFSSHRVSVLQKYLNEVKLLAGITIYIISLGAVEISMQVQNIDVLLAYYANIS